MSQQTRPSTDRPSKDVNDWKYGEQESDKHDSSLHQRHLIHRHGEMNEGIGSVVIVYVFYHVVKVASDESHTQTTHMCKTSTWDRGVLKVRDTDR